ncbi:hypothetical protein SMICM17S_05594 [Streptomyces microflavus]
MAALTWVEAPTARAPTLPVATLEPPSRNSTLLAGAASAPALRTVAVRVMVSDSTGAAGAAVMPVTWRSGLAAGAPSTWNSATWPAPEPLLAVNFSWTSATRAATGMVTVLPLAGLKA